MTDQSKMVFEFYDEDQQFVVESMWVAVLPESLYELRNVPFYAKGVAFLDVVSATERANDLLFARVEQQSGNSTVRIAMFEMERRTDVCDELGALGCSIEIAHVPTLLAVDIPKAVDWNEVRRRLDRLMEQGVIDYEEAAISRHHLEREPR